MSNKSAEKLGEAVGLFAILLFIFTYPMMLLFGALHAELGWFAPLGYWETMLFLLFVRGLGCAFNPISKKGCQAKAGCCK